MFPNSFNANPFLDRKEIRKSYIDSLIDQASSIDLDKVDFSNVDFNPRNQVVEKQKVYFWIRLYLHDEIDINVDTDITLTYRESGEKLVTKFICFAKKGIDKNMNEMVINYNPEDDRKILCLMIDADKIDNDGNDIPFIRTLFRTSKWFTPQILRKSDLVINDASGNELNFYDIDF